VPDVNALIRANTERWETPLSIFHAGSFYRFDSDAGIVGHNREAAQAGSPTRSFTIAHGLFTTPSRVLTSNGNTHDAVQPSSFNSTNFTVSYNTSGQPVIYWDAEVG
jgi:hypothetical protein